MSAARRAVRGLAAGFVAGIAAAAVAELARARSAEPGRLVDWDDVVRIARDRTASAPRLGPRERAAVEERYARLAGEVEPALFEALEAPRGGVHIPPFRALDRPGWAELNIDIVRRVAEPMLASGRVPDSLLTDLGRAGTDRYLAGLLAFLAGRVLGQFDPGLMSAGAAGTGLYLVETNVLQFEREAGLDGDGLRSWLILHEATHAWQFNAHPWLGAYMEDVLGRVVAAAGHPGQSPLLRLAGLTVGLPAQWRLVREVQAAMSLVEGYSNLVMEVAGRRVIPDFDRLEEAHRRRSATRSPLEVMFWKVTGLEMKLRQYRDGEAFCRAVRDAHGMAVLNLAWDARQNLPTAAELADPERWVRRVHGARRLVAG